ncbi:MAG TPA: saccharopine dehydrogenase NADP-binding domain-containing protein [Gemmataceae bacterium]|jgi:short subunit dehydrogenase-like uncharacterized protein
MSDLLIYGANGYTGALIAREAVAHGRRPILAGRTARAVAALATELGLEHRTFALDDPAAIAAGLRGVAAVLNCAGPFARTAGPLAGACLADRVHYLDVTGEIAVFEALAGRDREAGAAGVTLLPGVGFDVVPSDCLAAHLKRRLPTATRLTLVFQGLGRVSHGTATTLAENLHRGGMVRRGGRLTPVPAAWKTRAVDFGRGPVTAMTIPWGDVATAWYSTGIPNVEVYAAAPWSFRLAARLSRYVRPLLRRKRAQAAIVRRLTGGAAGPTAEERARGRSYLWGEVADAEGRTAAAREEGPEGYTLTVHAALAAAERVLAGGVPTGYQTPAAAFGPDFVLTLPGVRRIDLPGSDGARRGTGTRFATSSMGDAPPGPEFRPAREGER